MLRYAVLFLSLAFLSLGYMFRTKRLTAHIGSKNHPEESMEGAKRITTATQSDLATGRAQGSATTILGINPLFFSAAGWFLYGIYWSLHYQDYQDMNDSINAVFSLCAVPFFGFIAYKEISSIPQGGLEGLRFLSGITVFSMAGYAIVSSIPVVELYLEYVNAYLVSAFLTFTGFPAEAGEIDFSGNSYFFRSNDFILSVPIQHNGHDEILITLSCTAFSSIFLFSAAIFSAREPPATKLKAFLLIIPIIFIFNIIRMSMITYLTYTGTTSPEFAHHILGKIGSLMVLFFLAWVLFTFLPSILNSVSEVFDIFFGKKSAPEKEKTR